MVMQSQMLRTVQTTLNNSTHKIYQVLTVDMNYIALVKTAVCKYIIRLLSGNTDRKFGSTLILFVNHTIVQLHPATVQVDFSLSNSVWKIHTKHL